MTYFRRLDEINGSENLEFKKNSRYFNFFFLKKGSSSFDPHEAAWGVGFGHLGYVCEENGPKRWLNPTHSKKNLIKINHNIITFYIKLIIFITI